jgi:hypothetical protein
MGVLSISVEPTLFSTPSGIAKSYDGKTHDNSIAFKNNLPNVIDISLYYKSQIKSFDLYYLPTLSTGYNSQALTISPLVSHKLFLSKTLGDFHIKASIPIGKSGGKVVEKPWTVSGLDFSYATAKPFSEMNIDYMQEVLLSVSIEYKFSL